MRRSKQAPVFILTSFFPLCRGGAERDCKGLLTFTFPTNLLFHSLKSGFGVIYCDTARVQNTVWY